MSERLMGASRVPSASFAFLLWAWVCVCVAFPDTLEVGVFMRLFTIDLLNALNTY